MIYEERIDTQIWVGGTTKYNNEIIELGLVIYDDYIKGRYKITNCRGNYIRKSSLGREYYSYGMFNERDREDIIFEVSDVDNYIDNSITKWRNNKNNINKKLSMSIEDILSGKGYYAMLINNYSHYTYDVTPVRVDSYSLKYPYKMYGEKNSYRDMTREEFMSIIESGRLVPFDEEGIKLLKERTKAVVAKEL